MCVCVWLLYVEEERCVGCRLEERGCLGKGGVCAYVAGYSLATPRRLYCFTLLSPCILPRLSLRLLPRLVPRPYSRLFPRLCSSLSPSLFTSIPR